MVCLLSCLQNDSQNDRTTSAWLAEAINQSRQTTERSRVTYTIEVTVHRTVTASYLGNFGASTDVHVAAMTDSMYTAAVLLARWSTDDN